MATARLFVPRRLAIRRIVRSVGGETGSEGSRIAAERARAAPGRPAPSIR